MGVVKIISCYRSGIRRVFVDVISSRISDDMYDPQALNMIRMI